MTYFSLRTFSLSLFLLLVLVACTTERDGFAYRSFHNTTAHFNGYYNAQVLVREAELKLQESHKDDYEEILPLFIYGDEESAKGIYADMEKAIEKSSKVIERHKMEVAKRYEKKSKRPEINKWMDDNYFLIGQAYFYKQSYFKAEELFQYVGRKYKNPEAQVKSGTWLARAQIQRGAWSNAKQSLIRVEQTKEFPEELRADFHLVSADFHIRQENYKEAAEQIEFALRYIKKDKEQVRPTFVYAQLLERLNKSNASVEAYQRVIKLRPPYEMKFYAQINQAMAYSRKGGDSQAIKDKLFKMLRDEKNIEYRDQIHYALADLYLEERDKDTGIYHLLAAAAENKDNKRQKAKTFLRLSDIYFDDRVYPLAQTYYDSTAQFLREDHPRYKDVQNRAESLTDLVNHIETVTLQDSLQKLCGLSEEELDKKIKSVQAEILAELERKDKAEKEAMAKASAGGSGNVETGAFWVYNPAVIQKGLVNFRNVWGDRPLEDNWRRSNKIQNSFDVAKADTADASIAEPLSVNLEDLVPSAEDLMASLPCSPSEMQASNNDISEALYLSGVIYKEKLKDYENAVESWEVLISRSADSDFHPTAMYQLYRTYLFKEQEEDYQNPFCESCNSIYWANQIRTLYANSDWAKLVDNPEYLDFKELKEAEERKVYEGVFDKFHNRRYIDVIMNAQEIMDSEPENHLICKYQMLRALSIGYMDGMSGQDENFRKELLKIGEDCPDTEEAGMAKEYLQELYGGATTTASKDNKDSTAVTETKAPSPYVFSATSRHYLAIAMDLDAGDANIMKMNIADFNDKYFLSSNLKVSSTLLSKEKQIILVKSFLKLDEAQSYLESFKKSDDLENIHHSEHDLFLISKENYVTLFKSKMLDEYKTFFEEEYQK